MLDYVIKKTELSKGITLSDYIKLTGLTEDNWLLIKDYHTSKLITGVRADCLTGSEKDYYVVIVENYIFPQYTEHSERPYYIVVYISKTPVDFIPVVHTSIEVEKIEAQEEENTSEPKHPEEDAEEQSEMIDTNMGAMPIEDYREIRAIQYGFDSYEDFRKAGYYLNVDKPNILEPNPQAEENNQGVELTPLELILFQHYKEILEYHSFLFSSYLSAASDEESNDEEIIETYDIASSRALAVVDRLEVIISEAELMEKFDLWLAQCEKQEALTII